MARHVAYVGQFEYASETAVTDHQRLVEAYERGKAIIILNPADPPIMMRNTVYAIPSEAFDEAAVIASVERMEAEVQAYVPGYHLKNAPVFETQATPTGANEQS